MNKNYEIIDKSKFKKINQYNWFRTFPDPTYGFNVKINVTKLIEFNKKHHYSFFITFIYLVTISMNEVYEMHLREIDNEKTIAYFPKINPTYTVLSNKNGVFYNARTDLTASFKEFYTNCRNTIDFFKNEEDIVLDYNSDDLAVYYISCITSLSMESMKHPTPAYNYVSNSVPRVFWDKYYYNELDNNYYVTLNITVSHTLVDGFPLTDAFNNLIKNIDNLEEILNN